MRAVAASGWEIIATWEELTVRVRAWARSAMNRWAAGDQIPGRDRRPGRGSGRLLTGSQRDQGCQHGDDEQVGDLAAGAVAGEDPAASNEPNRTGDLIADA
jgi:hypothetical protein